jgi:hypothetical protein
MPSAATRLIYDEPGVAQLIGWVAVTILTAMVLKRRMKRQ